MVEFGQFVQFGAICCTLKHSQSAFVRTEVPSFLWNDGMSPRQWSWIVIRCCVKLSVLCSWFVGYLTGGLALLNVMLRKTLFGFLFVPAIVLVSCSHIETSTNALVASGEDQATRYELLPGNGGVLSGDLQLQEFAKYVHRAMALEGFQIASGPQDADLKSISCMRSAIPNNTFLSSRTRDPGQLEERTFDSIREQISEDGGGMGGARKRDEFV